MDFSIALNCRGTSSGRDPASAGRSFVVAATYHSNMLSKDVEAAVSWIDAAIDVLGSVDLTGLSAGDLVRLAGRCGDPVSAGRRWCAATSHPEIGRRDVSEVGGAPHKRSCRLAADQLAEARRRAVMVEPLASRTTLPGEPPPSRQPETARGLARFPRRRTCAGYPAVSTDFKDRGPCARGPRKPDKSASPNTSRFRSSARL